MIKIKSGEVKNVGVISNLRAVCCANCLQMHDTEDEALVCSHTGALELKIFKGVISTECCHGGAIIRSNTQGVFPIVDLSWVEKNYCGLRLLLTCMVEKCYLRQGCEFAFSDEVEIASIEEAMLRGWLPSDPYIVIKLADSDFVKEVQRVIYLLESGELEIIDNSWVA